MLLCMRTTIDINDDVLRRAKRAATDRGETLRELVERALRGHLAASGSRTSYALSWTPDSGRLLPGVCIEDRDSLFDVMDGRV
jgi:hypothetical protein